MNYLLDTHVLLWALAEPGKLGAYARTLLTDPRHEVWVSSASLWEIAIKYQAGKLPLPGAPVSLFPPYLEAAGFRTLAVQPVHALAVGALPAIHRDPFDRMLVVQAIHEGLTFMTVDPVFERYGVAIVHADQ